MALLDVLCVLSLPCVLYVESFAFALYLIRYVSYLRLRSCALCLLYRLSLCLLPYFLTRLLPCFLSGFRFCLGAVDLRVLSLYIISLDKHSYIKLATNHYRWLVCFIWHLNIYLTFRPLRPIIIYHPSTGGPSTVRPSTGSSTVYLTLVQPSCITYSTGLTQALCLSQKL